MRAETSKTPDTEGYLVIGALLIGLGLMLLATSLSAYTHLRNAETTLEETLEHQGLQEIPGVNLDEEIMFWLALSVVGCAMTIAGAALTLTVLRKKR